LLRPLPLDPVGDSDPKYVSLARITQSLKGYTAREANRRLGRTGQPFWQDESYDHWVRSEAELVRVVEYIESDPVRSGLTTWPEEWRWSSCWERSHGRLVGQAF
jgi:putative transposase